MLASGPRIFVSYARSDGKAFARRLSERLRAEGFSLWRDLADMEGGRDWWQQIEETIRAVEYLILVITAAALRSEYVRKEWRFARQEGRCVIPVLADKDLTGSEAFRALPGWMQRAHFVDADDPEQATRLLRTLEKPCEVRRVPFMAGDPPAGYVERPRETEALIGHLVHGETREPVAITGVLQGAGGFGKTALARALCHDPRIEEAFDDGILWVTLGEQPGDLMGRISDLIFVLVGTRPAFDQLQTATAELAKALGDRRMLMVVDDVWDAAHLMPFLQGGHHCARLVTTRNRSTVPASAEAVAVDAMQLAEAMALLGAGLPRDQEAAMARLAKRLGEWPLLLKLVNGQLRERVLTLHEPLAKAVDRVERALTRRGITAFDVENASQRDLAVAETLDASLALLNASEQQRFAELAVFPEDAEVSLAAVETLWSATADLDDLDTEDLARKLFRFSLLLDLDLAQRRLRLHDVVRAYMLPPKDSLAAAQAALVEAYRSRCADGWASGPDDGYFFRFLPYHLAAAGRRDELKALLADYAWIEAKLKATDFQSVISDYDLIANEPDLSLVQRALRLSIPALARDRKHLPSQLIGRLRGIDEPRLRARLEKASAGPGTAWLCPQTASLIAPGPLLQTFAGHTSTVTALAVLPDGRALSGSWDGTLRLWNLASGKSRVLTGHTSRVTALAMLPDGRALSGSYDRTDVGDESRAVFRRRTLRLWDLESGESRALTGYTGAVTALAVLPDGRALSGSSDHTLRLWDLASGDSHVLTGHTGAVTALVMLPDGRALSGSSDGTLRLWNLASGESRVLMGHTSTVKALAVLPDGRALSGSSDCTLRLLDLASGDSHVLTGHTGAVTALVMLPDGRALSGSSDHTLRLWDLASGESRVLTGHTGTVTTLAVLPDGRALSGSSDNTLRLWDLASGESRVPTGHTSTVTTLAVLPDGRAFSGSSDETLRLWDLASGESRVLTGHTSMVTTLAVLPDGRALSGSSDNTLRLWDLASGESRVLTGHTSTVTTLAVLPDGRALSGSYDRTLRLWGLASVESVNQHYRLSRRRTRYPLKSIVEDVTRRARHLRVLTGHMSTVMALVVLPDGRALSGSSDGTLRLWDLASGESRVLMGHTSTVKALAVLPDGRALSGSSDRTLRLWDLTSGESRVLAGHTGAVTALVVLPDGRALSGSSDRTLRLWDLASGESRVLAGHTDQITALAVLPDGRALSGSDDGSVIVWDVTHAAPLAAFVGDAAITCVAATPTHLLAGSANGAVHILRFCPRKDSQLS